MLDISQFVVNQATPVGRNLLKVRLDPTTSPCQLCAFPVTAQQIQRYHKECKKLFLGENPWICGASNPSQAQFFVRNFTYAFSNHGAQCPFVLHEAPHLYVAHTINKTHLDVTVGGT